MERRLGRVLIDKASIERRVEELAGQIAADFEEIAGPVLMSEKNPASLTIIPIMTGSVVFLADLIRNLPLMKRIGTVQRQADYRLR